MGTDQSVCSGARLPCGEAGTGWGRGQLAWGSPAPDRQSPAGMHWSQGHSVPWHGASWARPVRLEVGITFFPQHMRHREGKPPPSLEISKPQLDKALSNNIWSHFWPCLEQEVGLTDLSRSLPLLASSVLFCFVSLQVSGENNYIDKKDIQALYLDWSRHYFFSKTLSFRCLARCTQRTVSWRDKTKQNQNKTEQENSKFWCPSPVQKLGKISWEPAELANITQCNTEKGRLNSTSADFPPSASSMKSETMDIFHLFTDLKPSEVLHKVN